MIQKRDPVKRIVLTGGPGAGKTAVLELLKHQLPQNLAVLPEAASLIYGGGFWRHDTIPGKKAAQRAIYYVQRELETLVSEEGLFPLALCDRGTLDGAAYWPGSFDEFCQELKTSQAAELARYHAVIHLRTPALSQGYNYQNPLRTESAEQAAAIDERILLAWAQHPRRIIINSCDNFLEKANRALGHIKQELALSQPHMMQGPRR